MRTLRLSLAAFALLLALGSALCTLTPARRAPGMSELPPAPAYVFPQGFLWGAALAGHQAESQQASDWTAFEREVFAHGRFQSGEAYGTTLPGHIRDFGRWSEEVRRQKSAFDRFHAADIAMAGDFGLNALRVSIEWARLFPRAGMTEPDPAGIAYYEALFAEMHARGIAPIATLFHYVSPAWFFARDAAGKRGWERADALSHWQRFVTAVAEHFIPTVGIWCTLNEPMVYLQSGYIDGLYPPLEHRADLAATADVYVALLKAHALAYRTLHRVAALRGATLLVGITQAAQVFAPLRNWHPADRVVAALVDQAWNWDFLDAIQRGRLAITANGVERALPEIAGTQDYVGLNYYTRIYIRGSLLHPAQPEVLYRDPAHLEEPVNDMGWTIYPRGLYELLTRTSKRYRLPIYVLENGDADQSVEDWGRMRYLLAHLRELWLALRDGADVRGYVAWSLLDNFEWVDGFGPRFGLIAVDYENGFARTPRRSASLYGAIARTNALPAARAP
jgi:beta-glucosidase